MWIYIILAELRKRGKKNDCSLFSTDPCTHSWYFFTWFSHGCSISLYRKRKCRISELPKQKSLSNNYYLKIFIKIVSSKKEKGLYKEEPSPE
jgi:hypothetical protein